MNEDCILRAHIPLTTNIVADTRRRKQLGSSNIAILLGVFNKTIIPIAFVGYEIVIANEARIIVKYPIFLTSFTEWLFDIFFVYCVTVKTIYRMDLP